MDIFCKEIISLLFSIITFIILKRFEAKPSIIFGSPYNSLFNIDKNLKFQINTIFISNVGNKGAEDIQLFFGAKPDFITISPQIDYTTKTIDNKETFCVHIPFLSAKDSFLLQIFSWKSAPEYPNIKCKNGKIRRFPIEPQPVYPKIFTFIGAILSILGFALLIYFLLSLIILLLNK